jgi:hypothetical protein
MVDIEDLKSAIASEMENSVSNELVEKKRLAMEYYNGNLPAKLDTAGRSGVVSTDVADSVEWLLPNIVESLTGKAVRFSPMSQMDEDQAQLEEEITAFAFNEDNNGFLAMYESVKDALLTGVGIMKIYFDDTPERSVESYTGLDENQLQALLGDPAVEITEITRSETDGTGVTCARIIRQGRVRVEAVPCEEFRVSEDADSLNVQEARFAAHTVRRSASDLLALGYDEEAIENASQTYLEREVGTYSLPDMNDESTKQIVVTEAYLNYDINDDGIAELIRVVYIGESDPDEILEISECPCKPFVAMSAIPMPHEFVGTSIFERMQPIQDVKTAVLRATLDGMYYQNHKQRVVVEGQCNLDDLLVNRPGGIIRAKSPNAVTELGGNFFSGEALQLLTYADTQKDSRVGVSPMGSGQNALEANDSSHGVERIMSAREMLVQMMIRAVAETGLKPAYTMVRDLLVRYQTTPTTWKFKGVWQAVSPSSWGDRSRIRVAVGTGTKDDQMKVGALSQLLGVQQQIMQTDPMNPLVDYNKIHSTLSDIVRYTELGESDKFMYDPQSPEGQQFGQMKQQQGEQQQQQAMAQQEQQIQMQQAALQAQMQVAQAEQTKAAAQMENGRMKNEVDMIKSQSQNRIEALEAQLKALKESQDQEIKRAELQSKMALELTKLEVQAQRDLSAENEANKSPVKAVPAASN